MPQEYKNCEAELLKEMEMQEGTPPEKRPFWERMKELIIAHKLKTVYTVIIILLTAGACVPVYRLGDKSAISSLAAERVRETVNEKQKEYDDLDGKKEKIEKAIENIAEKSAENGNINVQIKEHEEQISELSAKLDEAKKLSETLDKQLEERHAENSQMSSLGGGEEGKSKTISADIYSCPSEIEEGTYKISGESGNIIVYDDSGSVRLSKKLESIDGNEFTFSITEGERLKVDKKVKLTEIGD